MKKVILSLCILAGFLFGNTLAEIKQNGVIRVGVLGDEPPFSSVEDGDFTGFDIDFAKRIVRDIVGENGKVELVEVTTHNRIEALQNNQVDLVIAEFIIDPERENLVDFSMPYFAVNTGILTKKDDHYKKISELRSKIILVETDTEAEKDLKKAGFNVKGCEDMFHCYSELKAGRGDAFAGANLIVLAYPILDKKLEVNIESFGTASYYAIGVKKGNKDLLSALNKELINLSKEGFFKEAYENTLNPFYKGTADKKYFLLDDIYRIFG
ncbi:periplasmic cysteine-binding protein [Campylobacter blaseri]|uniref:Amino acid ABC transporter substrate-binding protein n=1 Tax=Campylobacter blaseri TaxID=2042961 RepID=A0A2P8R0X4_9BACT|nr:transporter substrate-binding domain-containing protein [Campylobacter blaseri]PSM52153.1 amino acid ABC transporter substrate-binding protein [Campylobacter blaseri]PSM53919.1 amino acid ABC transporter substrate-binding protein [Campylobacter blaseri]QKF85353.1 periplasmic cysteine-binding protein [Campylobacter blaseri]